MDISEQRLLVWPWSKPLEYILVNPVLDQKNMFAQNKGMAIHTVFSNLIYSETNYANAIQVINLQAYSSGSTA